MKKTKGNTAVIVISCLLVVLMGVSLIASLGRRGSHGSWGTSPGWSDSTIDSGGGGSGSGTENEDGSCLHRDANDDSFCDYCDEVFSDRSDCVHCDADDDSLCDYCSELYSDGADGTFGGTLVNSLTFDEPVSFSYLDPGTVEGVTFGIKYGYVTTYDGYLHFSTLETDEGTTNDSYFSFNFIDEDQYISADFCDYITIDFDFWSDSTYIHNSQFALFGQNASGGRIWTAEQAMKIYKNSIGAYLTLNARELDTNFGYLNSGIENTVHLTYVIEINHEDITKSKVRVYLNGEFITEESTLFTNADFHTFHHLRLLISKQTVEVGKSLCFDNFEVCKFGNGSGYNGEISKLFESDTARLQDNADSVIANKS